MKVGDHIWVRLAQDPETKYRGIITRIVGRYGREMPEVKGRCWVYAKVEFHADDSRQLHIGPGGVAAGFDEIEPRTTNS